MFLPVEVEDSDNCPGISMQVFETKGQPREVSQVLTARAGEPDAPLWATGWSSTDSGSPCPAYVVPVSDSGGGVAYLLYGGDWGVRFRPVGQDEGWDIHSPHQWGEPYLLLNSETDILAEPKT